MSMKMNVFIAVCSVVVPISVCGCGASNKSPMGAAEADRGGKRQVPNLDPQPNDVTKNVGSEKTPATIINKAEERTGVDQAEVSSATTVPHDAKKPVETPPNAEPVREWKSADGRFSVQARLIEVVDGGKKIRLEKTGGKVITVPFEQLSKPGQEFLRKRETERVLFGLDDPAPKPGAQSKPSTTAATKLLESHEPRAWTDETGLNKTMATFQMISDGKVNLQKTDGTIVSLPIEKFSVADRVHLSSKSPEAGVIISNAESRALRKLKGLGATTHAGGELWIIGKQFDDQSFGNLLAITRVKHLTIQVGSITDQGMANLAALNQLTSLKMAVCPITNDGLKYLSPLTNLETLELATMELSVEGVSHLSGLVNLRHLMVGSMPVTDGVIPHIEGMTKLMELELQKTKITGKGFGRLQRMAKLRKLNLFDSELNDNGLREIGGLKDLAELDVSDTNITDDGLPHLTGLTKLNVLNLGGTHISGKGLSHLQTLKSLTFLGLRGTPVTREEASRLKSSLPNTRIQIQEPGRSIEEL